MWRFLSQMGGALEYLHRHGNCANFTNFYQLLPMQRVRYLAPRSEARQHPRGDKSRDWARSMEGMYSYSLYVPFYLFIFAKVE